MKSTRINLQILDKISMHRLSFQGAPTNLLPDGTSQLNVRLLQAKNVILSGEFHPMSEDTFRENLIKGKVNVQQEITPETEILICGKYPDWMLVEEARLYGIKIIFVDKAGEFFSRIATKLCESSRPVLCYKEPMGV